MAKETTVPVGISTERLAQLLIQLQPSALLKYAGDGSYAAKHLPASYMIPSPGETVTCIRVIRRYPDAEFVSMVEEALGSIARDGVSIVDVSAARADLYYYPKEE